MIGVLVSGEGSNLQALLDAALPVVAVASNREGVRALDRAGAAGLPAGTFELDGFDDREQRDATMANWLQEHGVRVVVCAGYMHVLTPPFLERFPERIVNVHPSLLPGRERSRTHSRRASRRRASPCTWSTRASTPGRSSGRSPSPSSPARPSSNGSTRSNTGCCPRW